MRNTIFTSWRKYALVALTTIAISVTAAVTTVGAADEVTVSGHSPEEVIAKWDQYKPTFNSASGDLFVEQPKLTPPHMPGKLKQAYVQDGVNLANFARYLAGLNDDLVQDAALNEQAQYGTVLMAASNQFDHHPSKPANMDEAFFQKGYSSTSSSNMLGGRGGRR